MDSYVDDELVLFGTARPIRNPDWRAAVAAVHNDTVHERDLLLALDIDRAQHKTRRDGRAVYDRWPPVEGTSLIRPD